MAFLEILCGGREGQVFEVTSTTTVGSGKEADIRLQDDGISRKHAKVDLVSGKIEVTDLGSSNGTYVNFKRLDKDKAATIKDRDIVFFGRTVTKYWDKKPAKPGSSNDSGGAISDDELKTLLRGTVPIKALEKLNNPALVAAARKIALDAERAEAMRRLGFENMSADQITQLLNKAKS